jgi:hypothetical protein
VWGWVRRGVPRGGFASRGGGSQPGNVARPDSYRPFGSSFRLLFFLTCQTQKTARRGRTARTGMNGKSGLVRLSAHTWLSLFFLLLFVLLSLAGRTPHGGRSHGALSFFLFLSFFYFPLFFWTLLFVRTCQILLGSRFMLLRGLATEGGCHGARGGQCVVGKNGEKRRRARV